MSEANDLSRPAMDSVPANEHSALLEAELFRGLASDKSERMTAAEWNRIRVEVQRRLADAKSRPQ